MKWFSKFNFNETHKTILIFGGISAIVLLLLQIEQWSFLALGGGENIALITSSVFFLILGLATYKYLFPKLKTSFKKQVESNLSNQELKILQLVADGRSNKEIAKKLFIAETTVKSHVSNILKKLKVKRRTEAVKIGNELGIL